MAREFDFYVVPTPIGNIQDITFRAVEVLKSVDLIACEDTRVTQKLLNHYDIRTKCISYHKYNERERIGFFLKELGEGKKIALVSDAGTPMICDPGAVIVPELIKNGFTVTSLPGACAVTTFLSQIPREGEDFTFIGFIGRTQKQIEEVVKIHAAQNMVFYDSPERILKTLDVIKGVRGEVRIALGRELSKLFEEVVADTVSNVLEHFKDGIKGEIICMVYADEDVSASDLDFKIKELKTKGFKDKEISVILSSLFGFNKNEVYKKSLTL
ncbi:MAG: 16S rRNA (cytidine(1402)-2'-O)-methyltransferase [Candidatus Gastranaerophilales bacterium]|nr:16S rRNA (cytidine(1402)-2'-O)-methyltransferase [Candidatus Gastranaerophilales bacterium]